MRTTRKRALSLMLSGIMTASLLPSYLTQLSIPAAADDPPESDYTPDTDPTIDFDYANTHNILNAEDALRDLAALQKTYHDYTSDDVAEGTVVGNYASYNKFPWKHASKITCHEHSKGSIRTLLESTSPNDTFIALSDSEEYHTTENEGYEWEPIRITTDKVLDLNGHRLTMRHGGNVNHSKTDPRQEYDSEEAFYMTMFEIDEGATLTIIDSSGWIAGKEGIGKIAFYADYFDLFNWDYERYTQRDLFHVMNGNLIIYGGTYEAGQTNVQKKKVSEFSWKKLKTAIGTAVELGVNIAKYATGISTAEAGYQDALKKVADMESGTANPSPLETNETQKNQPNDKNSGRNQSVSEKAAEKDKKIAEGKERGTPEGENTADSEGKAKDDTNTMVAKAKNEVVNAAVNKDGIMGMVNSGFSLVDQIVDMCGTKSYPPISDTIMGTAVRVGTAGTFASYGGTYIGYGSTPDTRNAVVEVLVDPVSEWTWDHSKKDGGRVYIYDGDFKADAGANVFNICRDKGKGEYQVRSYKEGEDGSMSNTITFDEHYGVEELFYQNQDKLGKGMIGNGKVYDEYGTEIVPEPITTANIQVRGGTFHCHYNLMNAAKLEKGAEELEHGHTAEPYFRRCPGTSGMVNLGVNSFGENLIRDGRIQIVDNSAGCLVLMDDRQVDDKGLYHYRLYCGDNELRTKSYLKVYPNNDAQINASNSMQLATYYGADGQTNKIFKEDEKGENIRSPYRQTENYFDFQLDDPFRSRYSVKPNFRDTKTGEMDVYGEKTSASEVWYYPAPLDYSGNPIGQIPKDKKGNPLSDVAYGYTRLKYYGDKNDLYKIVGHDQYQALDSAYVNGKERYCLIDRNLLDDNNWDAIMSESKNYNAKWGKEIVEYTNIRTNMKYFTYKVYQVDPLTRENLNANGKYAGDDPLLTVRYGCAPEETALRCKLPLDEVERRIKMAHPDWQGYRAGEMYRIVLEVEEHIGIGEQQNSTFNYNMGDFGKTLKPAATTTSILFRCYEAAEGYEAEGHKEIQYYDTDFTPLQWPAYPTNMHTIPAGQKHTIELRNGKTGMVDWEADARVFDIYYQWWEVDEEGNPLKLLAGTDNIFNDGRSKYNEHGAGNDSYKKELQTEIAEEKAASSTDNDVVYELKDKAKHKPGGWKLKYEKPDGERFHYANTVDPDETQEQMMDDPEYPNITGLPGFVTEQECKWTAEQLHMYTAETTGQEILKADKSKNLTLYNNNVTANQTDSCYIPMEMIGKRVRVAAIALNVRWPLAFDKKQTFWSHTMEVCDPNSPEGYLNVKTDENEEFGKDVPATFSVQKLRDFYDGSKISSVTYVAYGKYKTFGFASNKIVSNIAALPSAKYPKEFSNITESEPDLWQDFYEDYKDDDGPYAIIGLTDNVRLAQIGESEYTDAMNVSFAILKPAPKISGSFRIKPDEGYDPDNLDATQPATISVTGLNGMNAGETISGVTYYAFGKEKVFENLSIYDVKDIPEARYPAGFTEIDSLLARAVQQRHGDVWVKVTTSKGSKPYREAFLSERYPRLKGTAGFTYDEGMSYATFDHPVKLSVDNLTGLAYNEEVTAICYKLLDSTGEVTFTKADNPEMFADGLPSAVYPNDFFDYNYGGNFESSFSATVTVERKSPKQTSTGGIIDRFTGSGDSEGSVSTGIRKETGIIEGSAVIGTGIRRETGTVAGSMIQGTGMEMTPVKSDSDDIRPMVFDSLIGKSSARRVRFIPKNFEKFRYKVKAEKIVRNGYEVEEIKLSDIRNGKYDNGIIAFKVQPVTATIGYNLSDYTVTDETVAVLMQDQLKNVGIKATLVVQEDPDAGYVATGDYDMALYCMIADTGGDPYYCVDA
ncbi:MAG: hypothetical protein J5722_10185, partial [Oscillospiraceae bacterium]|nr:hypothetical protein [Oscillospiraceae bacterium]